MTQQAGTVRARWSWALYDFANTIWSMNVVSLYFATWLVVDLGASNASYSWGTAVSSLLMAISIPVLGAISDVRRQRVRWVAGFTIASCVATGLVGMLASGYHLPVFGEDAAGTSLRPETYHLTGWPLLGIMAAFTVASYAYQAAQPFYNAMLPDLVEPAEQGRLSGLGTGVGYAGTIVGLFLVAPFFDGTIPFVGELPHGAMATIRGVVPATEVPGRAATFMPTAVLFLGFSLPLILFCRDRPQGGRPAAVSWRAAIAGVAHTIRDTRRYPGLGRFLVASFIYQDAAGTIAAVLGLYAIQAVGFAQREVNTLYILLTVPAVVGSYACGWLVDRIGARRTLIGVLGAWCILLAGVALLPGKPAFWACGALIGFIFGGIPTAERPLLLSLVPEAEAGRYFSLMLLSSRAASVVGPLVWAYTVDGLAPLHGNGVAYRAAVCWVLAAFLLALWVLRKLRAGEVPSA